MRVIILTVIFSILVVSAGNAQTKELHEMGVKGYALVLDMQFEEANKIFDEMVRKEPENALGHLLMALSYGRMWESNGSDKKLGKKYEGLLEKTLDIAEEMLDKNEDDINALFYAGCANGKLDLYYMHTGEKIKAYTNGRKGTDFLEEVVEKDPLYYDAYVGIGLFHYYIRILSEQSKMLSMVVGDTEGFREKGIDEINLAISKGKYVNDEAKIILATDIYMDFDDNDKAALPLLNEITAKYPGNHFLKLHLIECYRNLNKYELALQTAEDLVQSESLKKNKYLINRLYYNIGSAYLKLNESEKAIMAFKSALEAPQYKASSLYYIGYSYEMMRRIDKAYEYYYQIEESDDKNLYKSAKSRMDNPLTLARIKFIKGTNYLECGKYTQAAEILNNLIKVELKKEKPDKMFMANVYFNIGRVEYELKEYERAIQTFQKVLDSNDVKADFVKPWCHYYLENIYRDTGKTEKAKKEYDAAYKHEGKVLRPLIEEARKKMQ